MSKKNNNSRLSGIKRYLLIAVIFLALGIGVGAGNHDQPPFDLLPTFMRGLSTTLRLTAFGALLALVVALIAGVARLSRFFPVRAITGFYVEFFRGTSVLVQMFWIFFVLPFFGINLSSFQAGVLALGLNVGAYGAEVVRGAIQATEKGQVEAAIALNMSPMLRLRRVILPQAMVRITPPFGNLLIELLKATSLASLINLSDVTFQALTLRMTVGRTQELFIILLLIYFLIAYPLTLGVRWLESRRQWV